MKWGEQELLVWILVLIPVLIITGFMLRRREKRLQQMAAQPLWSIMLPGHSARRAKTANLLRVLAIACALLALARPQWGFRWKNVTQRGLNIMVALDTSKSMLAQDIKPNRLQQAKWGIRDLVKQLKGDRIGLIDFAGEAFLQCPATIDYAAFLMMLEDTYAGIIPLGGTDLYEALQDSIDSFEDETAADKVIILISDGEGHTGDPLELIPKLQKEKIRVFTIGVGTLGGELIQTSDGFVKDQKGNVVKSSLNENMLKTIALQTGGFYVRSAPGDFGLERVYEQGISQLQREDKESRVTKVWHERFPWFLGAALLFLLMEATMRPSQSKRHASPKPSSPKPSRAARSMALIALLLISFSAHGEETPRSAMRKGVKAYHAGDYTNAVELLEKTALEFPDIGNYNLGNAHFRLGDYEAAEKAYHEALRSEDVALQEKAYFNRGNALLARTTALSGPEEINTAAELAFQAVDMFEKALLLQPQDLEAKRNFEKAQNLRHDLEFNKGKWLFDRAEELLKEYKAKDAKKFFMQAKQQFEHILEDVNPGDKKASQYLPNTIERLDMLKRAVEEAEQDLKAAEVFITNYQYLLAGQRLTKETDERKYAFDLKPDLKKKYEESAKKITEVLDIIKAHDTNLNL